MCIAHDDGMDEYLTTAQVAESVGIDPSTISRWVKEGRIAPAHRLPGRTGAMLWKPGIVDDLRAELALTPEQAS